MEAADGEEMKSFDALENGYLPGWPGRSKQMDTTGGVHLFRFTPGEDEVMKITDTYSTILKAERHYNYLLGVGERGWFKGNLKLYYPKFLYKVLQTAQTRVTDCLHGDKKEHYQALSDSYGRMRGCVSGRGKKNFAQPENPLS